MSGNRSLLEIFFLMLVVVGIIVFSGRLCLAAIHFTEGFEGDPNQWTLDSPWTVSSECVHGGSYSLNDSHGTTYDNNIDSSAMVMVNLLSATRPLLTFWHRYNFQSYKDFGFVEVSTDNRASWKRIYFITGYSGTHWEQAEIDLGPYANKQIWLRFRITTDGSEVYDGWHIDDIEISDNTAALSYPFFDDMESGTGNWILGSWGLVSNGYSGAWCMNDSPDGHTPLSSDNVLVLAGEIDLTYAVNPQLTFWQSYYLESTSGGGGYVQISTNGGLEWVDLARYYGNTGWHRIQIDLSSYIGLNVLIRFNRVNKTNYIRDGWYIDDVHIGEDCSTIPVSMIDQAILEAPSNLIVNVNEQTDPVYSLVFENGLTEGTGQGAGIVAQLGYGPDGSDPGSGGWIWVDAVYYNDAGDSDRYEASLIIDTYGNYDYAYRFRMDTSNIWAYADLNGNNLGECGTQVLVKVIEIV